MKTKTIRIREEDWKKIKKSLPSWKGETASSYFFRLTEEMYLLKAYYLAGGEDGQRRTR